MKKIAFVTASPETVSSFLLSYASMLTQDNELHVITNLNGEANIRGLPKNITIHNVGIAREPSIFKDIKAMYKLFTLFKSEKFDVVHSFTPKAGLLAQIAGYMARIEFRFHTFTGQVWVTKKGMSRWLFKLLDRLIATLATFCLVDSPSQQEFLFKENVVNKHNSKVLANGSISGVNLNKFMYSNELREQFRKTHHIDKDDFIFLYVGRLKIEKGIPELINAFTRLPKSIPAKLILIGSDEDNLQPLYENVNNIMYLGFKKNISDYYSFADVLCLPSHREGFGNVVIEAAACKLPTIASNIYGLSDAIKDNYSGLLHNVKDETSILSAMSYLLNNPNILEDMRINAHARVMNTFDEQILVNEFQSFYSMMFDLKC